MEAKSWMLISCEQCGLMFYWSRSTPKDPPAKGEGLCDGCDEYRRGYKACFDGVVANLTRTRDDLHRKMEAVKLLAQAWIDTADVELSGDPSPAERETCETQRQCGEALKSVIEDPTEWLSVADLAVSIVESLQGQAREGSESDG